MREIKFRFWDGISMIYEMKVYHPVDLCKPYNFSLQVMQYTGLEDKNGEEIYEGDIVTVLRTDSFKPYNAEVYFASGCFCTEWYNPLEKRRKAQPIFDWENEIIGNFYENPELLEEQKDARTKSSADST